MISKQDSNPMIVPLDKDMVRMKVTVIGHKAPKYYLSIY